VAAVPGGRDVGFVGAFTTTDTIARLGQLYLRGGRWDGRRILPESWVAHATSLQVRTDNQPHPDWRQGDGFGFWMSRHGYRGDGAYGQFCLVLPDQDAVVAYTERPIAMQALLDLAWQHLLPAFGGDVSRSAGAQLARQLNTLTVPAPPAGPNPPAGPRSWSHAFAPAGDRCAAQRSLISVEVAGHVPEVVLRDAGTHLRPRLGLGTWAISEPTPGPGQPAVPVAAIGGWADASTMRFDAIFLETPHRLQVTCDRNTGTFTATWATPPLLPMDLRDLHAPRTPTTLRTAGPVAPGS
jgi:hypothetical protein